MKLYSLKSGFKKARKKAGFTQKGLAREMNVSLKTIMNWEQGLVNPPLETVIKIADLLDCDIDFLCGRIECKTHDFQFIHDKTGLSEKSLELINEFPKMCEPLNSLLELDYMEFAMEVLSRIPEFLNYSCLYACYNKLYEDAFSDGLWDAIISGKTDNKFWDRLTKKRNEAGDSMIITKAAIQHYFERVLDRLAEKSKDTVTPEMTEKFKKDLQNVND